ncbi:MAG: MlaD family protein [Pseudomonadota bacterium]
MTESELDVQEPMVEKSGGRHWPSLVWLVPVLAVLGAIALLIDNIATRGPLITIVLADATGITAGETVVKYRDVTVGRVESLTFSEDLKSVHANARMNREVEPYLNSTAEFWVVSPRISAQGITGLETVISGSYIGASWNSKAGTEKRKFFAAETPPLTPEGTPGLRINLRAADGGSLDIGSPIFFKRVQVGHVERKELTPDGSAVDFTVFIRAPNDKLVQKGSRFWNVSGVDFSLGANGAQLHIASLISLIRGGVSFDTIEPGKGAAVAGETYKLYDSRAKANENAETGGLVDQVVFEILFDGSVRGLNAGASVEYRGIRVGRVDSVAAAVDAATNTFRTKTMIGISPALLSLPEGDKDEVISFMRAAVARGLRAKLAMGNLLTGALYVSLEEVENAKPETIGERDGVLVLPSVRSNLDELAGSVEGVIRRVNDLPIEALIGNAVRLLENINKLVENDDTQAVPKEALDLLASAKALIASPEIKQTTVDAEGLMSSLRAMIENPALAQTPEHVGALVASLAALSDQLEKADTAANLAATIAALRGIAEDPDTAALPGEANRTLAAAQALLTDPSLLDVPAQINLSLESVRRTLELPGLADVPNEMRLALASLRARLDDPGLAQATAELGPLLGEARQAISGVTRQLDPTLASLRALLDDPGTRATPGELRETLAAARSLLADEGLRDAIGEATMTLAALRNLLDAPGTRATPQELASTLAAARSLLVSLEQAKAAENLSQTLAATRRLVDNPALIKASDALAGTLTALQGVLVAPGMDELPEATTQALISATRLIDQFQQENLGKAAAGALEGVNQASNAVKVSVQGLPELVARLKDVAAKADGLLASLGVGSELNYEAVAAIRDIRDTARAITSLADLVEQKPNAFILGK